MTKEAKLKSLKKKKKFYWDLVKAEEYFLYPTDTEQDLENYKTLCKQIESLENEIKPRD